MTVDETIGIDPENYDLELAEDARVQGFEEGKRIGYGEGYDDGQLSRHSGTVGMMS